MVPDGEVWGPVVFRCKKPFRLAMALWAICLVMKSERSCVPFAGFLMQGLRGWGITWSTLILGFSKTLWSGGRWESGRSGEAGIGSVGLGGGPRCCRDLGESPGPASPLPPPPSCLSQTS